MFTDSTRSSAAEIKPATDEYPDLSNLTITKVPHKNLILSGVCSNCGHCGQPLTDSVSVQRGIGPTCSKRGYSEDPVDGDEMEAFICLAEFRELVEFLTEHYKPLGIRGLVNGLVRVASLNRPRGRGQSEGNVKVFAACCDAIEALGHRSMANLLRHTLISVWVDPVDGSPGVFSVKPLKRKTPEWWWRRVQGDISGARWDRFQSAHIVRFHDAADAKVSVPATFPDANGRPVSNKRALWELIIEAFEGGFMKHGEKVIKIERPDRRAKTGG